MKKIVFHRKATILLAMFLAGAGMAHADDGFSRFTSFFEPGDSASYGLSLEPGANDRPQVLAQAIRGSAVFKKTDAGTWSMTGRADHEGFTRSPVLPRTGARFPDSLWNLQGGGAFARKLGDRRQWGANVSVGSASDEPFHSVRETQLQATGSVTVPSGERNSWIFLLTYSNNRTFANGIPLPGFAYLARVPDRGLTVAAGFPFVFVNYAPTEEWGAKATLIGPSNQSVEFSRRISGPARAYCSIEHGAQTWFRAGRVTRSDRLIYEEKKAALGVRTPVMTGVSLDVSAGRTFGRRMFEAKDVRSQDVSKIHLSDGWLLSASVSARWGRT